MGDHPLRKLLSGILAKEDPSQFSVAYVHRGAQDNTANIRASSIGRVGKGWFMLIDDEIMIPFHRILYVRNDKEGVLLWVKRFTGAAESPHL